MYYRCTRDLYSIVIDGLLKFSKDGIYKRVSKDVYINNQGDVDEIFIEGWQKYFVPFNLDDVNIEEAVNILQLELVEN